MTLATATKPNPRQKKYPPRIVAFARRLYEGEYSIREVEAALAKRGYTPKRDTLLYWVDEDFREAKLMQQRAKRRKGVGRRGVPARRKAWRYRLDRMEELRKLKLSYLAIANLMSRDFHDLELSEFQVRSILKQEISEASIKALLWPKGMK